MLQLPEYLPCGDNAIMVEYGKTISESLNFKVRRLMYSLDKQYQEEIIELVPAYSSLMIVYNPLKLGFNQLIEKLRLIEADMEMETYFESEAIHIPVLYGGEFGADINFVAHHNNLTIDEVVKIHSEKDYLIYMLGFMPGFPYLGGMNEKIAAPRLDKPRARILSGSVGIADKQTGIYPIESPGGWRIIGRTPLRLFDISNPKPILLETGKHIRFVPIDEYEYRNIQEMLACNSYNIEKSLRKGSDDQ